MSNEFLNAALGTFEGSTQIADGFGDIDWNTVETEGSFEPLPEGDYALTIEKAELKTSMAGAQQISLTYAVQGTKRKVFDNLTFKDPAGYQPKTGKNGQPIYPSKIGQSRIKAILEIANIPPSEFKFSEIFRLNGVTLTGHLKIDEYNGKRKNKVSSIKKLAAAAATGGTPF